MTAVVELSISINMTWRGVYLQLGLNFLLILYNTIFVGIHAFSAFYSPSKYWNNLLMTVYLHRWNDFRFRFDVVGLCLCATQDYKLKFSQIISFSKTNSMTLTSTIFLYGHWSEPQYHTIECWTYIGEFTWEHTHTHTYIYIYIYIYT